MNTSRIENLGLAVVVLMAILFLGQTIFPQVKTTLEKALSIPETKTEVRVTL